MTPALPQPLPSAQPPCRYRGRRLSNAGAELSFMKDRWQSRWAAGRSPHFFAVRLGKVSLSRVCHPLPRRCRLWSAPAFFCPDGTLSRSRHLHRCTAEQRDEIAALHFDLLPAQVRAVRETCRGDKGRDLAPPISSWSALCRGPFSPRT